MATIIYLLLVFLYVILFAWFVRIMREESTFTGDVLIDETSLLLLVILGLFYDNGVIALGNWLGEGILLKVLSYIRYLFHALFTPTLILFIWKICDNIQFPFTRKVWSKIVAYIVTFTLISYELFMVIFKIKLEPIKKYGLLTYEQTDSVNNSFIVIIISLVLGLVSIMLIIRHKQFVLFVGIIVMSIGALLSTSISKFPIMNASEMVLIISLILTKQFQVEYVRKSIR